MEPQNDQGKQPTQPLEPVVEQEQENTLEETQPENPIYEPEPISQQGQQAVPPTVQQVPAMPATGYYPQPVQPVQGQVWNGYGYVPAQPVYYAQPVAYPNAGVQVVYPQAAPAMPAVQPQAPVVQYVFDDPNKKVVDPEVAKDRQVLQLASFVINIVTIALLLVLTVFAYKSFSYFGLLLLVPLAWMIPMSFHAWNLSQGKKVCTSVFAICEMFLVNPVSGILLFLSR